jgi:hypothetical protein
MGNMKRVTIPMSDKLVKLALVNTEQNIKNLMDSDCLDGATKDSLSYTHFDYVGLIGIFSGDYKVTIEISQDDFDSFSHKHGVDFPAFIDLEVVDIEGEEDGGEEEEVKDEELKLKFIHLAYVEDDELTFALKSNVQLPGFEDLGDSDDDDDDMKFTSYKGGKPGEVVSHKGTPFIAVPTSFGWVIINDGVVVEEIKF